MKILLIITFLLTFTYYAHGQESNDRPKNKSKTKIIETAPEPNGGIKGFMKFLSSNITYPEDARNQKKEGQVLIEFVVSSDGTIKSESLRIVKGVFESTDNEAKRVINLSPNGLLAPATDNLSTCEW